MVDMVRLVGVGEGLVDRHVIVNDSLCGVPISNAVPHWMDSCVPARIVTDRVLATTSGRITNKATSKPETDKAITCFFCTRLSFHQPESVSHLKVDRGHVGRVGMTDRVLDSLLALAFTSLNSRGTMDAP